MQAGYRRVEKSKCEEEEEQRKRLMCGEEERYGEEIEE